MKTHSDKIREAVSDLREATPNEIMEWIKKHYPEETVNPQSYRADIIGSSVNHSSQHHYPSLQKFLFFNKDTKKYRMANPSESKTEKKEEQDLEENDDATTYVDGVPIAKLSVTGQIVVPLRIRQKMGFNAGDTLAFVINEKGLLEIKKARLRLEFS